MSATVDAERKEDAFHGRLEKAKERMRGFQSVLCCEVEGLTVADTARRLSISVSTVRLWRVYLGLDTSLAPLRARLARAEKRCDCEEATP